MITFFRSIRKNLITEGIATRYLKYAVGEIILVVIGILIALQINNWNNEKQQEKIEIKYLKELKENLKKDLNDIEFNISFNESKLTSNKIILDYLNGQTAEVDSIEFHFSNLFFSTRTLVNMSAYENLKSRGLEIISNDSLRQQITTLYEFNFYNTIDFETKDDHEFQYQILVPEITKNLNITQFNVNGGNISGAAKPINKEMLSKNHSFKNALIVNHTIRHLMTETYINLKHNVEKCIHEIDFELDRK